MRRTALSAASVIVTALVATACQDSPTAPALAPTPPSFETIRYFDNSRFADEYTAFAPCANGGLGEFVLVQRSGRTLVHAVQANDGQNRMLHDFFQLHATAVGLTTGDVYQLVDVYQETGSRRFDEIVSATKTITYVARMLHQGSGVELSIRAIIHSTLNADGEGTVYFERETRETLECTLR